MIVSLLCLVGIVVLVCAVLLKQKSSANANDSAELIRNQEQVAAQLRESMLKQMLEFQTTVTNSLAVQSDSMSKQINHSTGQNLKQSEQMHQIIANVQEKLTNLENTNKQVVGVTDELKMLQNMLMNPKQRGGVGEYFLNSTLDNMFPPNSWQSQYKIDEGKVVDAVIFLDGKVLPIDSKFSLENYNRFIEAPTGSPERDTYEKAVASDLKGRIDETAKYIDPKKGTMDFAFMFIPSEALYYDLVINKVGSGISSRDLVEYAFNERKVVIVSPTTFMAYLQTVMQGLRALQIEQNAQEIQKQVGKLRTHVQKYDELLKKLGSSLSTTVTHYNNATKNFELLDGDMAKITDGTKLIERDNLDKPQIGDSE